VIEPAGDVDSVIAVFGIGIVERRSMIAIHGSASCLVLRQNSPNAVEP
ncbi:MAG: ribulose kinase, partial [Planctomycetaceae bacterium]